MSYGKMTVGDLRKAIEGLSDRAPVLIRPENGREFENWSYNTREVHNAYQANDDRYTENGVLLIELGGTSP